MYNDCFLQAIQGLKNEKSPERNKIFKALLLTGTGEITIVGFLNDLLVDHVDEFPDLFIPEAPFMGSAFLLE